MKRKIKVAILILVALALAELATQQAITEGIVGMP